MANIKYLSFEYIIVKRVQIVCLWRKYFTLSSLNEYLKNMGEDNAYWWSRSFVSLCWGKSSLVLCVFNLTLHIFNQGVLTTHSNVIWYFITFKINVFVCIYACKVCCWSLITLLKIVWEVEMEGTEMIQNRWIYFSPETSLQL